MNKTGRNTLIDDLDAWTIIRSILGENDHISMVKHHLESYNDFVKNKIGIIGDIGSGKSFVAKLFGYPVFNADIEVARIYKKDR